LIRALITRLERAVVVCGVGVSRLGIPLVVLSIACQPVARWMGWSNDVPVSEISTLAFLAATMTSFGYAYAQGAHVRLDILSRRFTPRANAGIELLATLLILMPLCAVVVIDGVDSTWRSFAQGERLGDTALALQWAVRLWVPVGFALLMVAGLASALRSALLLLDR
jgi:TRAP-type mannitol/chloroaromatic compound transport system permease small subunit